ncbi:hypothetical protein PR048_010884 [Dryococelus australis]|uniref:HTH CENPB-type domain-containing protein n=1 Tax=Dryococelus australis TaxID=614101 RepID=A0ABQ9I5W8_9NEOP|nr:hypothetical protein PR048_010884 [Dryococelus australis]
MSEIFKQWLHSFDAQMRAQNRKIVLFADHYPAHPKVNHRNIEHLHAASPPRCVLTSETSLQSYTCELIAEEGVNGQGFDQLKHPGCHQCLCGFMGKNPARSYSHHAGFRYQNPDIEEQQATAEQQEPVGWHLLAEKIELAFKFNDFVAADEGVQVSGEMTDQLIQMTTSTKKSSDDDDDTQAQTQTAVMEDLDVISNFHRLGKGESGVSIAKIYGVGTSNINDIKPKRAQLEQFASKLDCEEGALKRKTARSVKQQSLTRCTERPMICEKALRFNKQLNGPKDFKASSGWVMNIKSRHSIRDVFKEKFNKEALEKGNSRGDVYNTDETRINWQALPHKSLASRHA